MTTAPGQAPGPSASNNAQPVLFGTFAGVFRPTFLTILGAMFYLREGWLVGNAGLGGAFLVILAAVSITGLTSLSLASIATNVRVKPGGAFAIVAQALGLEAGAAIGIPLYVAQSLSAAMYLYAFSEAWVYVFPSHPAQLVAFVAFGLVGGVAWASAALAVRAQGAMFFVACAAILAALAGWFTADGYQSPQLVGSFSTASLVETFAIFFPGVTGIMVGAGMSGSLERPQRSIPRGILGAWLASTAVYLVGAVWYATMGTPEELATDTTFMMKNAAIGPVVLGGLLCSTLMAALSSLVASPRLLAAMAEDGVVPGAGWLKQHRGGEPRNAVLATTALAGAGLMAGSLDAIAPVITSFFIMTYLAINLVVYVEDAVGMISWRPTFQLPRVVSLVGAGACLLGLALGSPFGGALELLLVVGIYLMVYRRRLETPWETVRSGLAIQLAARAARQANRLGRSRRAWKPDLLVPVATVEQLEAMEPVILGMSVPNGSVRLVALGGREDLLAELPRASERLHGRKLDATWTALETNRYMEGIGIALDTLQGTLFPPNLVLVDVARVNDEELGIYLSNCKRHGVGLALYLAGIGKTQRDAKVRVWLSSRAPEWGLSLHEVNLDLPVLIGYIVSRRRKVGLELVTGVREAEDVAPGRAFLEDLISQARLPNTTVHVAQADLATMAERLPPASLHIFGVPPQISRERLEELRELLEAPCLFLMDSGHESALA